MNLNTVDSKSPKTQVETKLEQIKNKNLKSLAQVLVQSFISHLLQFLSSFLRFKTDLKIQIKTI